MSWCAGLWRRCAPYEGDMTDKEIEEIEAILESQTNGDALLTDVMGPGFPDPTAEDVWHRRGGE